MTNTKVGLLFRRPAFSLVELLVVVGVIALLIAMLLPSLAKAREAARRAECLSNLRQVHLSFHFYALNNRDQVPLGYRTASKQFNSMVYSKTSGRLTLFATRRSSRIWWPMPIGCKYGTRKGLMSFTATAQPVG